jgi:hypothetical protein
VTATATCNRRQSLFYVTFVQQMIQMVQFRSIAQSVKHSWGGGILHSHPPHKPEEIGDQWPHTSCDGAFIGVRALIGFFFFFFLSSYKRVCP